MSDVETAQTGAEVAPVVEVTDKPEQTQEAAQTPTTEQVETQSQESEKPRDEKGRFVPQERVNEITRARREAERRAQYLEQQLAQVQQQYAHQQPRNQNDRPPSLQEFETVEEWGAAVADYSARQALTRAEHTFQQRDQHYSQQQLAQQFQAKEAAYAAANPGYLDRIAEMTSAIQLHPDILAVIAGSEHGPAVADHLASHLDVADRVSRMSPVAAAAELGRIEARLSTPKPKPVTQAPAPVPTLSGSSVVSKDLASLSYEDYKRARSGG
jgi:hypothetical protein